MDISGSQIVEIESKDMVSNYMWRFRRSDAYLRNEWSNYTNWPYHNIKPSPIQTFDNQLMRNPANFPISGNVGIIGEANPYPINLKEIMIDLGITMDGVYRESIFPGGLYNYAEKYMRTSGDAKDGLYCYNFGINTTDMYQPSGAINLSRFKKIEFEF